MKLLFVGRGVGSWQMRGLQLASVLKGRTAAVPTEADLAWADAVVLVKRGYRDIVERVRAAGKPIIWDALDFWAQPMQNGLSEADAIRNMKEHLDRIRPALTIGATEQQARDLGGVYIPHHSRIGLTGRLVREQVQIVAYEGSERYLGQWRPWLETACHKRGWMFVVNSRDLSQADIIVAFRDGPWDGWMCREWKSGVKVGNAIAAGRPILMQDCAAWREMRPIGAVVETQDGLADALDFWASYEQRQRAAEHHKILAPLYEVRRVAEDYIGFVHNHAAECAA